MNPLKPVDKFLNGLTMYRLVLYALLVLAAAGIALSVTGDLALGTKSLLASLAGLAAVCYGVNKLMSQVWQAPSNTESSLITALILFMIMPPASTMNRFLVIVLAGLLAVASKYILALHNKHLFNPAAIAVVIVGLMGLLHASWWIGSSAMLPFTLVLGLLIIRKTRRTFMFASFLVLSLIVNTAIGVHHGRDVLEILKQAFSSSPIIFLGTIMLTEPATTPPKRLHQIIYGGLVGGLSVSQLRLDRIFMSPEISLVLGNIYSYIFSPKQTWLLKLKQVNQMSEKVFDFSFSSQKPLEFEPGQYMEWTLPHHSTDDRGNRRTFSIASSPTEQVVRLGAKFYQPGSSFKSALKSAKTGQLIAAGRVSGDFTLPKDQNKKLVFIAGGIGITPFRSMLKYLSDTNQKRDIVLFYVVSDPAEISYSDVLSEAGKIGLKLIKVLAPGPAPNSWAGLSGNLTYEAIIQVVPDLGQRLFYLSGPDAMVRGYKSMLIKNGVGLSNIKTDYFSGY